MLRYPVPTTLNGYNLIVTGSPVATLTPLLKRVSLQSRYASVVYVQAHVGTAIPSNGAVPICAPIHLSANLKNVEVDYADGISIPATGLVLVASSTAATLTVDAAATLDFSAYVEEWEYQTLPSGATTVGDLTTNVVGRAVWTDANGPKRLLRVRAKNTSGADRYLVVYAIDTPTSTSKILTWQKVLSGANCEMNFGTGFLPIDISTLLATRDGCRISWQTDLVQGNESIATDGAIEASYI